MEVCWNVVNFMFSLSRGSVSAPLPTGFSWIIRECYSIKLCSGLNYTNFHHFSSRVESVSHCSVLVIIRTPKNNCECARIKPELSKMKSQFMVSSLALMVIVLVLVFEAQEAMACGDKSQIGGRRRRPSRREPEGEKPFRQFVPCGGRNRESPKNADNGRFPLESDMPKRPDNGRWPFSSENRGRGNRRPPTRPYQRRPLDDDDHKEPLRRSPCARRRGGRRNPRY